MRAWRPPGELDDGAAYVVKASRPSCRDSQKLPKHDIRRLIGLIAHTCIEATVRYAAAFGHEVTMVKDAMADYPDGMMHAALDINRTISSKIVACDLL